MKPVTSRKRTLASATTYRVASTLLLWAITYVASGQIIDSMVITVTFAILATGVFYFNDRAWERTDWGRKPYGSASQGHRKISHVVSEVIPVKHEFLEEAS